jgi:death-on-curing protein
MEPPVWLDRTALLLLHEESLADFGGGSGLRDEGLLDSALARPLQLLAYGQPDIADLAASYAFGLAKNHPFVDGNKRTAFMAMTLFLELNGVQCTAPPADATVIMLELAAGGRSEAQLARWIRANVSRAAGEARAAQGRAKRQVKAKAPRKRVARKRPATSR